MVCDWGASCRWSSKGAASWPALSDLHLDANLMTGKLCTATCLCSTPCNARGLLGPLRTDIPAEGVYLDDADRSAEDFADGLRLRGVPARTVHIVLWSK